MTETTASSFITVEGEEAQDARSTGRSRDVFEADGAFRSAKVARDTAYADSMFRSSHSSRYFRGAKGDLVFRYFRGAKGDVLFRYFRGAKGEVLFRYFRGAKGDCQRANKSFPG